MGRNANADSRLKSTWENVWRTDDVEAEHLDSVAETPSSNTRLFRPYVDKVLAKYTDPTLLEAGCGLGQWLYYALARTNGNVIGLDLAAETLERVRNASTLAGYVAQGRVTFIAGDMRDISLPSNSVDVIFSFGVIEHVVSKDSQRTVDEFGRVLRPGGRLLLATPNVWCMHSVTRPILQALGKWRVGFERSISPTGLAKYCTRASLSIEEAGVMDSGVLFGDALTSRIPVLERISRVIERRQKRFGFMAYTVAYKTAV